jgi:hypothetical protein
MVLSRLHHRSWSLFAAGTAAAVLTIGCESDTSSPDVVDDPATQSADIDDPFGGYNRSSEPAGFGDPYLLGDEGEVLVADEMADDPEVNTMMDAPENDLYAVRLTWGYLAKDSTGTDEAVDWSGSASVDAGAVLAIRTIQFEQREGDHVVRPRDSRLLLEWESTTTRAMDGLQLLVLDPQDVEGNVFHIDVPLVDEDIEVTLLDGLDRMIQAGEAGHELRIQARRVEISTDCRRGWVSGRWDHNPDHPTDGRPEQGLVLGGFRGHWTNRDGEMGGSMRGIYGVNGRGHRVIFGKVIDHQGTFRGLVRGTWQPTASPGVGSFRAHWLDFDRQVVGGMRGVWERRDRDGAGFFHGAWATLCDEESDEVEIDASIF